MKKKLVLMTSALMTISLLSGCNKHVHNWGEVVYTWSQDNKTCTATRVCKGDESHVETETVDTTSVVVTEAKCEEDGLKRYTADFKTNEAFLYQTKDVTLKAVGHEWGAIAYTWADDYSSCTATRVCKNNSNHIESETADSAYTEIIPATCDTDGSAVYDVAFENKAFEVQSHEVTLPATGHDLIHHEAKAATRLESGNIEYWTCDVCGKYFSDEEGKNEINVEYVIIPALGTNKSYFNGTVWHYGAPATGYYLYLNYGYFNAYDLCYNYDFDDFDYNDTTKVLSFIVTQVHKFSAPNPSPYEVGDTISFIYDAEIEALLFGTYKLYK